MLGIRMIRNHRCGFWRSSLVESFWRFVEVITLGHYSINFGRSSVTWRCSLVCLAAHLVTILSFGYLYTDWVSNCWHKDCWSKYAKNH